MDGGEKVVEGKAVKQFYYVTHAFTTDLPDGHSEKLRNRKVTYVPGWTEHEYTTRIFSLR